MAARNYEEWRKLRLDYKNSDYFKKLIKERRDEWERLKEKNDELNCLYDYDFEVQKWMTNMDNLYNCFDCPFNNFLLNSILKEKIDRNIENCKNQCSVVAALKLIEYQRKDEIKEDEYIIEEIRSW